MIRTLVPAVLSLVLVAACDKPAPDASAAPEKAKVGTPPESAAPTEKPAESAAPAEKPTEIAITVGEDGFAPSEVKLEKGKAATLVFTRTTNETCAKEVELPELKVKKDLPLNEKVAITIPAGEPRTLGFQCGMGMYKSKIVVQ